MKIIQLLMSPNDSVWQGVLLGLGDDGITYHCQGDTWQPYIPPLKPQDVAAELTTVTEQRDQWKEKYIQQNKDLGHELRDPNGTIWSECKRLQTELTTVTEQRDRLADAHKLIATQLLYDELNEDQIEHADWETAYDEMIKISREALQSLNQPTEQ